MIKIYSTLFVSIFVFLVGGCTRRDQQDNLAVPCANGNIEVAVGVSSRGELVYDQEQMGSIGLYCAYTAGVAWSEEAIFDKMANKALYYQAQSGEWLYDGDTPTWGYSSLSDKYTFFAYSPRVDESSIIVPSIENGSLVVEYTAAEDCASQPDLMLATPRKDISAQVGGGAVALDFQHALSAIAFSVKGLASNQIKGVAITGVVANGKATISDSGEIEWELGERSQISYSAIINDQLTTSATEEQALTLTDGYLMMIPQSCDQVNLEVTIYNTMSGNTYTTLYSLASQAEWESGMIYNYTINLSDYDYTIEGTSNCYILHPNGSDQEFYIPVEGRINTFWRDYADQEDVLSCYDQWEASLLWSDYSGNTRGFNVSRVTSGYANNESVTSFCEPNFTTSGARSAMKVTLPWNIDEGNFLVVVTLNGNVLWSWHFWVTDYDPDLIAAQNSAIEGVYVYTYDDAQGAVHRYDNQDLWATLYRDRFIMDRNLGARDCDYAPNRDGVLHYQFGRKDPFPADSSLSPTLVDDCVTFAEAVQNPTTFYIRTAKPFSWNQESLTMGSSYLWFDKGVANDPDASGKSIFDPSPLGWRVPRYGTFTVLTDENSAYDSKNNQVLYNGVVQLPMTGFRSNMTGSIGDYGSQGNMRVSTQIDSSFGYNLVYNPDVDPDKNNTLTDGFCIRCIEE
ncbi:MAG: fimbrillin family protein [Rikenellaceae bacterium]